jgi:large repetitive protein
VNINLPDATLQSILELAGLVNSSGKVQAGWFSDPLQAVGASLQDTGGISALISLLDTLIPPFPQSGSYPLLGSQPGGSQPGGGQPNGNLYLTITPATGPAAGQPAIVGLAGEWHSGPSAPLNVQASMAANLLLLGGSGNSLVAPISQSTQNPPPPLMQAAITVDLGWTAGNGQVGLDSIELTLELAPGATTVTPSLTLNGLQLSDSAPKRDLSVDATSAGGALADIATALIVAALNGPSGGLQSALLTLLGMGSGPGTPDPIPLSDPSALRAWLARQVTANLQEWAAALATLLGGTSPSPLPNGNGVQLSWAAAPQFGLWLELTGTTSAPTLQVSVIVQPPGQQANPTLTASLILAQVPLAGPASAVFVPGGSALLAYNLTPPPPSSAVSADSVTAGLRFSPAGIVPVLELSNVTFEGNHYGDIDLSSANTILNTATSSIVTLLLNALGLSPAGGGASAATAVQHLAALAGLVPTAADNTLPTVSVSQFAGNPVTAIAEVHRQLLATGNWGAMFAELCSLLNLTSTGQPAGTLASPWLAQITASAAAPSVTVSLAAWNAAGPGAATQQLRLGIQAQVSVGALLLSWTCELFAADLTQNTPPAIAMGTGQHLVASAAKLPPIPVVADVAVSASSAEATVTWQPKTPVAWTVSVDGLAIAGEGQTVTIDSLTLPGMPTTLGTFSPDGANFGITGISATDLTLLVRLLLGRAAAAWGGPPGAALASLAGIRGRGPGVPFDWPTLAPPDQDDFRSLVTGLGQAYQAWIAKAVTGTSPSTGLPYAGSLLAWVQVLLNGALPAAGGSPFPLDLPITGSGTYTDPWAIPVDAGSGYVVEALAWLDPDGPPMAWLGALTELNSPPVDFDDALSQLGLLAPFVPGLQTTLTGIDPGTSATALGALQDFLRSGDGIVPVSSQLPAGWTAAAQVAQSAHADLPSDPTVISLVQAQLTAWAAAGGTQPPAVLLGPAFTTAATLWADLTAPAGGVPASAQFTFRVPGLTDASQADLSNVTDASAAFYAVDLYDDGSGDQAQIAAQIGRVVEYLANLRADPPVLVAHSSAGIAAAQYAAQAQGIRGIITIGTPHLGTTLDPLTTPTIASALRLLAAVAPGGFGAGPLEDAVSFMQAQLDPWTTPAAGAPPVAEPFPAASFQSTGPPPLGQLDTLAIASVLQVDLLTALAGSIQALTATASSAIRQPPTHLGLGARIGIGQTAAAVGDLNLTATLRADASRIALQPGTPPAAGAASQLTVAVELYKLGCWLAGDAGVYQNMQPPAPVRVRRALLTATITPGTGGQNAVAVQLELNDTAVNGPTVPNVGLNGPTAQQALGAVTQSVTASAPTEAVMQVLQALQSFGIMIDDPQNGWGLSQGAFAALRADPASYLSGRLAAALAGGLLGFAPATGSPVRTLTLGNLPVQAVITQVSGGWKLGLRTTAAGLSLTDDPQAVTGALDAELDTTTWTGSGSASLTIGALTVSYGAAARTVTLTALPWVDSLVLSQPGGTPAGAMQQALWRAAIAAGVSALGDALLGPGQRLGPVDALVLDLPRWLARPGIAGTSGSPDPQAVVGALVSTLIQSLGGSLPGGLSLQAATTQPGLEIGLQLPVNGGGSLAASLLLAIDSTWSLRPSGSFTLTVPQLLSNGDSGSVTLGVDSSGALNAALMIGGTTLTLLPHFSGFAQLAAKAAEAGAQYLLPAVLGALNPGGATALDTAVSGLVNGLELTSVQKLQALAAGAVTVPNPGQVATAIQGIITALWPQAQVTARGSTVTWAVSGQLSVSLALSASWPPTFMLTTQGQVLGPVTIAGTVTAGAGLTASVAAGWALPPQAGLGVTPTIVLQAGGASTSAWLWPLNTTAPSTSVTTSPSSPVSVKLLPGPPVLVSGSVTSILIALCWPLVSALLSGSNSSVTDALEKPLWNGGPTAQSVLNAFGILTAPTGNPALKPFSVPGFNLEDGLFSALGTLIGTFTVPAGPVTLSGITTPPKTLGVRFSTDPKTPINLGGSDVQVLVHLDRAFDPTSTISTSTTSAPATSSPGVTLILGSAATGFQPQLIIDGAGIELRGGSGQLVSTSVFTLDGASAYVLANIQPTASSPLLSVGGAAVLSQFGIPLGAAAGISGDGGNPVAASLLSSSAGGDSSSPDSQPVAPALDLALWRNLNPDGSRLKSRDGSAHLTLNGTDQAPAGSASGAAQQNQPVVIGVHEQLGPVSVDDVQLQLSPGAAPLTLSTEQLAIGIDGGVELAGLTIQVQDLSFSTALNQLANPSTWTLDLRGLAVAFQAPSVSIAGGLVKFQPAQAPPEYDGTLSAVVAGNGLTAIGSYAKPGDYTSFFVFLLLSAPLGGPPFLFVTGLAGGLGYNRALVVPADVADVASFPFIQAMSGQLGSDPQAVLTALETTVPVQRGALWLAAGVTFTSFALVNNVALAYVDLTGTGVEVGLLGTSSMQLPPDTGSFVIASLELALKARFSTAESLLSIQAQLTDNSWLIDPDCQLTGGFAFVIWFAEGQFLLSLGGYNPSFEPPPDWPVVPRLGFRWAVCPQVCVSGQFYFTLASSCVMAGGRLDASYSTSNISAWLTVFADFLAAWDPFGYEFDVGVEIGGSISVFGITWSGSVGAELYIMGPSLHGYVSVNLDVTSATISFGSSASSQPAAISWSAFQQRYLQPGLSIQPGTGIGAPAPGASPPQNGSDPNTAAGSQSNPWLIGASFSLTIGTQLPVTQYQAIAQAQGVATALDGGTSDQPQALPGNAVVDLAPMGPAWTGFTPCLTVQITAMTSNTGVRPLAIATSGVVPQATWQYQPPPITTAGANTLQLITTMTLAGGPQLQGSQYGPINVGSLIDASPFGPAPFSDAGGALSPADRNSYGTIAKKDASFAAMATPGQLVGAAQFLLSAANGGTMPALAVQAIAARSAPPALAPLALGLAMQPPGQDAPPQMVAELPAGPVPLKQPRLLAVVKQARAAAAPQPASPRTTVTGVAQPSVPRTAPPTAAGPPLGAVLLRRALQSEAPAVAGGRATISAAPGGAPAHLAAFAAAAQAVAADGVTVPAGVWHQWQLPGGDWSLRLSGDPARVVCLDRGGLPRLDVEVPGAPAEISIPAGTAAVAITCLGQAAASTGQPPRLGLVSDLAGPSGWQAATRAVQLSAHMLAVPGGSVITSAPLRDSSGRLAKAPADLTAGSVLPAAQAAETRLPAGLDAVAVFLSGAGDDATGFTVAADGARLVQPQLRRLPGSLVLVYPVTDPVPGAGELAIAIAPGPFTLSGVAGLHGDASSWADRLAAAPALQVVADSPLTAAGTVTAKLTERTGDG